MVMVQEENCGNCLFYMANPKVCRRYPPKPIMIGVKQGLASVNQQEPVVLSFFPNMMPTGWCGEWQSEPADLEKVNN